MRYGEKVYSPLIPLGSADYIVSFELLESLREIQYLSENGRLLVNRARIDPAPVATGSMEYPDDIEEWLTQNIKGSIILDTQGALKEAGSPKSLNIVMLGALSTFLGFSEEERKTALKSAVKEKLLDTSLKAFDIGRKLITT